MDWSLKNKSPSFCNVMGSSGRVHGPYSLFFRCNGNSSWLDRWHTTSIILESQNFRAWENIWAFTLFYRWQDGHLEMPQATQSIVWSPVTQGGIPASILLPPEVNQVCTKCTLGTCPVSSPPHLISGSFYFSPLTGPWTYQTGSHLRTFPYGASSAGTSLPRHSHHSVPAYRSPSQGDLLNLKLLSLVALVSIPSACSILCLTWDLRSHLCLLPFLSLLDFLLLRVFPQ